MPPDVGLGAATVLGLAVESESGEYEAPTKFFPVRSESLTWNQNTHIRRVLRGTVDPIGGIPADSHVEGDVDMEFLTDVVPYFLLAARGTLVQTENDPDEYEYEFVANHRATAEETLSITVVRNGVAFGYVGVAVSSLNVTIDDGILVVTLSLLGNREESVAVPTHAYGGDFPIGAGSYIIEIPAGTQVKDTDNFSFQVEDNGEAQNRLKDELGAEFIKFGERNLTVSVDRDFLNRAEYDQFKAVTEGSLRVRAEHREEDHVYVELDVPTQIKESYDINVGAVGDLVRASVTYQGIHDPVLGASYKLLLGTDEDLGLIE